MNVMVRGSWACVTTGIIAFLLTACPKDAQPTGCDPSCDPENCVFEEGWQCLADDVDTGSTGAPTTSAGPDPTTETDAGASDTTETDAGSSDNSSGEPDGIEADCATIFSEQDKRIGYYCECAIEAGDFPDLESCLMVYMPPAPPECICEILTADPANGPAMACQAATQVELFTCVSALDCADMDGISDCEVAAETNDAACPPITTASQAEVEMMCFG